MKFINWGGSLIILTLDASSSMFAYYAETVVGINAFLREQKAQPAEGSMIFSTFANRVRVNPPRTLAAFPDIGSNGMPYMPGGMTALFDGIGIPITEAKKWIAETPVENRPRRVLMVVQTDGEENVSKMFDLYSVANLIREQQAQGWEFLFLGADQLAKRQAQKLGITNSISYKGKDAETVFRAVSADVATYRDGGSVTKGARDLRRAGV